MVDVHLDYDAIGQILKETVAPLVHQMAERVAENVRADPNVPDGAHVSVKDFTTDRAVSVVLVAHPNATAMQAKAGILTGAAAAAGLEVKAK